MKYLIDMDHLPEIPAEMKIRLSRRGMLTAAADAAEERRRRQTGAPSYRIEDLAVWDQTALSEIVPAVNPRARISLQKNVIYAETAAAVDPIPLFPIDSPALFIFNQFNGRQTIAMVCKNAGSQFSWDEEHARAAVRAVFLKLCEVRVCEPGF